MHDGGRDLVFRKVERHDPPRGDRTKPCQGKDLALTVGVHGRGWRSWRYQDFRVNGL
jgi:hypothetical protein